MIKKLIIWIFRFKTATILGILLFWSLSNIAQEATPPAHAIITSAEGKYNPERTKKCDLIHTKLELKPDWAKQYLYGIATIKLKPHFYPQSSLDLDAKGFDIQSVTMNNTALKYDYDKKILKINLGREFSKKDTFQVQIQYTAKPNDIEVHGSEAISADKGLYFVNPEGRDAAKPRELWTQGETQANSCWFPTIDAPNQKSTEEIYLTVENSQITLSNGKLISSKNNADGTRTDYWKQDKPHAPYLFMFAVGEFKKVIDPTFKNFEVSYYVEPKYEPYALKIFGRTPEMIQYFEKILGVKYQWDKYAQIAVRDYVSGAMENTSATIHGESIQKNANQLVDDNDDGVIAHELFHHWFGDLVTCESWANLPLNESFADFAEYLWTNFKYGQDEGDLVIQNGLQQYLSETETKREPLIRYLYLDKEDMFDAHSYSKGGRILNTLRQTVGDEAFFVALNRYLNKNKFGTAELADLRIAFEETTGEDLNWFFDQWFLKAGHPELEVKQAVVDGAIRLKIKQLQDTLYSPIYRLPLKMQVWVNDTKQDYELTLTKAEQSFKFPVNAKPNLILLDPEKTLVGTINHQKSKEEWTYQYYHAERYPARMEALKQLIEVKNGQPEPLKDKQIRHVLIDATKDNFWKIRQFAVNQFSDYDGDEFLDIEKALQYRVEFDKRSLVRTDAILAMTNFQSGADIALFRKALRDSSYLVQAAALEALLKNRVEDAKDLASQFENTDNADIFAAVANYYADEAAPKHFDWFVQQIQKYTDGDLYRVMGTFGAYLVKSSPEIQLKSLPLLEKIARNNQQWYVRYVGVQTLVLLVSGNDTINIEAKKLLKDIILHERDVRLLKVYKNLKDL